MPEPTITDTFLGELYRQAGEGSHIFTVIGVEHYPNRVVYQNYHGEVDVEPNFWSLFHAVQQTLDNGELCVIMLRSMLTTGVGKPPVVVLRAWTLTPVGIIPVTAEELAANAEEESAAELLQSAAVVYANGWDQDLDFQPR